MKKILLLPMLVMIVWLGSCARSHVVVDQDSDRSMSRYRTFQFTGVAKGNKEHKNVLYQNERIQQDIHKYITQELETRGIAETKSNPDMKISYHAYTEKKQDPGTNSPLMNGVVSSPWGTSSVPYAGRQSSTYTEGTLMIDMIDTRTNELVWQGSIAGILDNPRTLNRQIEKAVTTIFKKYPVARSSEHTKIFTRRK